MLAVHGDLLQSARCLQKSAIAKPQLASGTMTKRKALVQSCIGLVAVAMEIGRPFLPFLRPSATNFL